jgi:hypothetical protein
MNFKIRNYRKISAADIELSKLTLICGKNAVGKTSLIDAIRSVASAQFNPFKEITKKEISMLVRSGSPSAYAEINEGDNKSRIDWPKCDYITRGEAVTVSDVASGIQSLVDMNLPERTNYIVNLMKASPTADDLKDELMESQIFNPGVDILNTDFFKRLWEGIDLNGWDAMHTQAKGRGAKYKAKWEIVSDVKDYGKRKADAYLPAKWEPDLEKTSEKDLIAEVNKHKEWTEAAIKDTAVSDFEVERLESISCNINGIKKKLDSLKKQQDICEDEMNIKKTRIRDLTSAKEVRGLICPSCQETLTLSGGELKKIPKSDHVTAGKNKAEIAQHEKDIKSLQVQNNELLSAWGAEKSSLKVARDAALKLKNVKLKQDGDKGANVEDVKNKLAYAEDRLAAFRQYKEAHKISGDIKLSKKLCDILAPAGLRNKKLTTALAKINNSMKLLTDPVGWGMIEVTPDCNITVSGTPYGRLIAKSERYRARVLLQLMVAMAENSRFVIIDDTDELTKSIRNDLLKVILRSDTQSIVVTALDNREDMPDLSKINGKAYWIDEGKVV